MANAATMTPNQIASRPSILMKGRAADDSAAPRAVKSFVRLQCGALLFRASDCPLCEYFVNCVAIMEDLIGQRLSILC